MMILRQYISNQNSVLVLQVDKIQWSEAETTIIKQAFQTAYQRETFTLITNVRDRASSITKLEDLWYLHDLLSTKRYEIDGKYDYDPSTVVFDFANLIKEGWLSLDDLKGLKPEVLSKISALLRM